MKINPLTAIDFYKADHRRQYPEGTTLVYSNFTPRSAKLANIPGDNTVVFFGLQFFIKEFLQETWNEGFFQRPKDEVVTEYKRRMDTSLGPNAIPVDHIEALHDLGFLPIEIRALPEGTRVPVGVPMLTIHNTLPEFFWLVNYLESVMSAYLWKPCVSATTAAWYKDLFEYYARETGFPVELTQFQGHDFSFRGMSGVQDAALSGAAHLLSFTGTDTVPAIDLLEKYYEADATKELIGCSVPATEHSVMCMGTQEDELATFKRLITELYPSGIVSIVSDTWDFWRVVTNYVPKLKHEILARSGGVPVDKVVIRPDSGDPVHIICGDPNAPVGSPEYKGAIECLWETFGGTITCTGHKLLDARIGLIYGDSITPDRAQRILEGLSDKGFCSGNVVLGIGSYTYQHVTRDTYGFAVKATYGIVNGEERDIYKCPKTDSGSKKSHKGLLKVIRNQEGNLEAVQGVTWDEENDDDNELKIVFNEGYVVCDYSLDDIRKRVVS